MPTKTCYICSEIKEETLFKKYYNRKKKLCYTNMCLTCSTKEYNKWREKNTEIYNKSTRKRRLEKKIRAIEYKGNCCARCGNSYHPVVYDFHHIDPTEKEVNPGNLLTCSDETLFKELDKCILLCANCHRLVHYE